jgi:hypothetical protein
MKRLKPFVKTFAVLQDIIEDGLQEDPAHLLGQDLRLEIQGPNPNGQGRSPAYGMISVYDGRFSTIEIYQRRKETVKQNQKIIHHPSFHRDIPLFPSSGIINKNFRPYVVDRAGGNEPWIQPY